MAGYLVLARKYRSLTFDEVVGQEPIAQTLVNAIKTGRVAHAYLFTGTRGVGKTTMARILAKALNCLKADAATPEPCNECDACDAIGRGEDIDVIEIDGASNRGIDEIRELRANSIYRPSRCRYKIYYIDEVHMLTKEAFNALLKTLEEPPEHVKFVFATTEVEKVPATIVSRCQRFDFRNIPTQLIADHLATICKAEKVKADQDALFRIARAGAGSMRDGLSLLDQLLAAGGTVSDAEVVRILGTPSDERVLAIATAIADGDSATALGELAGVLEAGVTLPSTTAAIGEVFRNMMLAATCGPSSQLIELPETQKKAVGELAARFSVPMLVQAVGILQTVGRSIRGSSVSRAMVEAGLVRLAEAEKFVDPASLIERLESLSGPASGQKKNSSVNAGGMNQRSPESPSAQPAEQADPESIEIQWQEAWLRANWPDVIAKLFAIRQSQVAGCLRTAVVVSFADDALELGFNGGHENLRQRCAGPLGEAIQQAMSKLAGKQIACKYVSLGDSAPQPTVVAPRELSLSSTEKREIQNDPAVQEVLSLFGGEIVNMEKQTSPATEAGEDE